MVVGDKPGCVDGAPAKVDIPRARTVLSIEKAVEFVRDMAPDKITATDTLTGRNAPRVFVHSRKLGGSTRHLIVNTDDKREVRAVVDLGIQAGSAPRC